MRIDLSLESFFLEHDIARCTPDSVTVAQLILIGCASFATQTFALTVSVPYHKPPFHSCTSTPDSSSRHLRYSSIARSKYLTSQLRKLNIISAKRPTTIAKRQLLTRALKEMGRGGRGGGSRNPANQSREVQVSRKLSWLLRHGANSEGLKLGKGGYVNVQDAVSLRYTTMHASLYSERATSMAFSWCKKKYRQDQASCYS